MRADALRTPARRVDSAFVPYLGPALRGVYMATSPMGRESAQSIDRSSAIVGVRSLDMAMLYISWRPGRSDYVTVPPRLFRKD